MTASYYVWRVICDDESWSCATRAEAREWAAKVSRHPGNRDIRRHGHGAYVNVDGEVRIRRIRRIRAGHPCCGSRLRRVTP